MLITSLRRKSSRARRPIPRNSRDIFATDRFYYQEITTLTKAGGWSIDFENKKSHFDTEARRILEVPEDYMPSLKDGSLFYAEEHMEKAQELFFKCAQGEAFETKIKMVIYKGRIFWAKAQGKPLINFDGQIIGIRGVFQDIDKDREKKLKASFKSD